MTPLDANINIGDLITLKDLSEYRVLEIKEDLLKCLLLSENQTTDININEVKLIQKTLW